MNKLLIYISITLGIAFLASCNEKNDITQTSSEVEKSTANKKHISITQQQFDSSGYHMGPISERAFNRKVQAIGSITIPHKEKAIVSTLIEGKVGSYSIQEGQWVKKGQRLFNISNPDLIDLQEVYLTSLSQVNYLQSELSRLRALGAEDLAPKSKITQVNAELDQARAKLASVDKKLDLYGIAKPSATQPNFVKSLSIHAPISGYISEINIVEGSYMEATDHAISIINTARLKMDLAILEKDISKIEKGDSVQFTLANNPTSIFTGNVQIIGHEMHGNTYLVACSIHNQKQLRAGAKVNATIITGKQISNCLPNEAIVQSEGKSYILVLNRKEGDTLLFDQIEIQLGQTSDEISEIITEIDLSNKVILLKGSYYLL